LLEYLQSFSGLEELRICCTHDDRGETEPLAESFFNKAIPRHLKTLSIMEISPQVEGSWCFGRASFMDVSQYTNVHDLTVSVSPAEIPTPDGYNALVGFLSNQTTGRLI
jgi:hypothetical protein